MSVENQSTLIIDKLSKSYTRKLVVQNISLQVKQGEAVGLLGPNGAGKTTCFYMIAGLIKVDSGRIFIDDEEITELPVYKRAKLGIGYLPQEASIFRDMSVEDNIDAVLEIVYKRHHKAERLAEVERLLQEFSLEHIRKSKGISLSGGERRRAEIARALALKPKFILLDEPFAGIDPLAVAEIIETVKQLKKKNIGVLITDHNVRETLKIVDRAYITYAGKVLKEGTPTEIKADEMVKKFYLGNQFD